MLLLRVLPYHHPVPRLQPHQPPLHQADPASTRVILGTLRRQRTTLHRSLLRLHHPRSMLRHPLLHPLLAPILPLRHQVDSAEDRPITNLPQYPHQVNHCCGRANFSSTLAVGRGVQSATIWATNMEIRVIRIRAVGTSMARRIRVR